MYIEEKDGIRILHPDYGYFLQNKETGDIHVGRIYLAVSSSSDDFIEIRDENVSDALFVSLQDIKRKEESLNKVGKVVANSVTDDATALSIQEFYDIWSAGVSYEVGRYLQYTGILYKVLQAHTSQESWTPDNTPSLYAKVLVDPSGETILDWVQPDSTNGYMKGDKVRYDGVIYESTIDNNIWCPADYPAGWKVVEG